MHIDPNAIDSDAFWRAYDLLIPEKERAQAVGGLDRQIEQTQAYIRETLERSHADADRGAIESVVERLLKKRKIKNRSASDYLDFRVERTRDKISIRWKKTALAISKETEFGKRILFTYNKELSAEEIISHYHNRYKVEECFRNFKGGDIVEFRPIYHWTDSKIRIQTFVNVLSYLLIKIVKMKLTRIGEEMSLSTMVELLEDIKEVTIVYDLDRVVTKLTEQKDIQKRMLKCLNIELFNSS